jgi:hypothetical protein
MAVALAYPEGIKYKRGGSILSSGKNGDDDGPSAGYISKARFVLRHCRDKADNFQTPAIPGNSPGMAMIPRGL